MRVSLTTASASLVCFLCAGAAFAQPADPRLAEERQPAGWSVTPRVTTGTAYDDNVLIQGEGDVLASDLNTAVTPGGSLDYVGKLGSFNASYTGSLQLYRDFSSLNSFDHDISVTGRRLVSKHMLAYVQQTFAKMATTELPALVGIPFARVGSRTYGLRGGIEATATKRLSFTGSYRFEWVAFDKDPVLGVPLSGGHANGGAGGLKYQLNTRTALTADYELQSGIVSDGTHFTVQNGWTGADYRLSEYSHVFGAVGIARFESADPGSGKTSPAWRFGYGRRFEAAAVDVTYAKSFLPSYGGSGTLSNEEITSTLHVPIGRRVYADGNFSWRRNEPLVDLDLPLRSMWIGATVGYAVQPWMRVEGFYGGTHQNIDRPGGQLDRNRIGIQVVTAKPVRIR